MCDSYNIEFKLRERLRESATHESAADYWDSQVHCCRRLEHKIYSTSAVTFVCSDADAEAGRQFCPQGKFVVIGNGVDTTYFRRCGVVEENPEPLLVFTGGFGYEPNADAVVHFIARILPFVRLAVPNCRFVFAGRAAGGLFEKLQLTDPLVTAIDSPEDMRPVFESATVFVVPLLSGGGTRLKILEAMAMQLPIVSTAIGAEGIDCSPGQHLLIADSDQEFARAVVELLQDETRRRTMGQAARTWVCANMDWKIHREQLKKVVLDYARLRASDPKL
jgi:glycosyltransferase involved in cell wall biosynthesis